MVRRRAAGREQWMPNVECGGWPTVEMLLWSTLSNFADVQRLALYVT